MKLADLNRPVGIGERRRTTRNESDMQKKRTCLKCSQFFRSSGPANRICQRCQHANARLPRFTEAQLQLQRGVKRHNGELMEPCVER